MHERGDMGHMEGVKVGENRGNPCWRSYPLDEQIKERQRKNKTMANAYQARTKFVFLVVGMGKKRKGGRECSRKRLSSFQGEGGAK